jgi:hypothetical protein
MENSMKNFYLAMAIVGAVVPYIFFAEFMGAAGLDLAAFVGALFVNGAAGGFAADLLITSAVFWTYMFSRAEGPKPWLFIVLNLTIGLSCALPAYLFAITRRSEMQALPADTQPA